MSPSVLQHFAIFAAVVLVSPAAADADAAPAASGGAPAQFQTAPPGAESPTQAELRTKAAHRQRRIILNNDGDDSLAPMKDGSPVAEQFLRQRTSPLAGSQVDTISYCSIRSFGSVLHRTEVAENLTTHLKGSFPNSLMSGLLSQGTDPLQVMLEFCHAKKIEVFCSMRMNDTHDAANPALRPQLKVDHPEYLLGSETKKPLYGQWTAVDYGQAAVRELAVRYIQEVCTRYDVDGVELDFFRHPVLFKAHAYNGAVGDGERELLTEMLRRIRAVADAAGTRRGRPILIAIRVPDSVEYCRTIGIDLERWLREGLTDLLATGGYFRLNPWEYSVRLGHQYGISVYPSMDAPVAVLDPRVPAREFTLTEKLTWVTATEERPMDARRNSLESWSGRAAVALKAGADGVYLFNLFTPTHPLLWQIGDPASLAGKNKLYFVNWRGTRQPPSNFVPKSNTFFHERPLNPLFPLEITSTPLSVPLPVGDETPAAKNRRARPTLTAELWIQPAASIASVTVTCNGRLLERGTTDSDRVKFALDADLIKPGSNVFVLRRPADGGAPKAFLRDIVLQVEYPDGR